MVNNEQIESEELQRDIDDLKRMQQEHISKSYPNPLASPFDDLDEEHVAWLKKKNTKIIGSIVEQFQVLYDHFIPLSTAGYDDPRKDHSGPAASTVVRDNQILFKKTLLKLGD
ncbi:unnamed protein product [Rotaria magnacalcarata]|uniref:Uncharacterized protein n=1 Tax=Rotaria magnacalcarata TaxID=392030 RepID=A0A816V1T6_9BILA|nr:unnamed protein product [Rotaria magnacalcarata]CAF5047704.1 unnamed protein product [Rotaria magnacalcarata]